MLLWKAKRSERKATAHCCKNPVNLDVLMLQNNGHIMVHFTYIINVRLFLRTMWPQRVFMTLKWTDRELLMLFDDAQHFCWPGSSYLGSHFRIVYIVKAFHQIPSAAWACTAESATTEQKQLLCCWKEEWMSFETSAESNFDCVSGFTIV